MQQFLQYTVGAGQVNLDGQEFTGAKDGLTHADGTGPLTSLHVNVGAGNLTIERK